MRGAEGENRPPEHQDRPKACILGMPGASVSSGPAEEETIS